MGNKKRQDATEKTTKSLKTLLLFIILVVLCLGISLTIRVALLLQKSSFDGTHRLTIAIQSGKTMTRILSVDPQDSSLTDLQINGPLPLDSVGKTVGIVMDGTVNKSAGTDISQPPSTLLWNVAFDPGKTSNHLTMIDLLRLSLLIKSFDGRNITTLSATLPKDESQLAVIIGTNFLDPTIAKENISIQIINASGISGMGNRLERVLDGIGGNVVSVRTATEETEHSTLTYYGDLSYTLQKIAWITHLTGSQTTEKSIGDITITIGKDQSHTGNY